MNNNLKLLYVEDNEIVRENFEIIFSKYFATIITAENGEEALKLYKEHNFDVAILDISIPKLNGLELAKIMREMDKKIEILMLSGHSEKEKLLKAIHLELFHYFVKPVQKDELHTTLLRLIEKLNKNERVQLKDAYSFDVKQKNLFYKEELIKTSNYEKKLLSFLSTNKNTYHSACEISEAIFGEEPQEDILCNNVVQLISRFKKKMIKLYGEESFFIDNIYGLGYKLN